MKCDVCDTKIPIGGHQCPNCGYKMPVKKGNAFNINSSTHEHIESSTPSYQKKTTSFSGTDMSLQAKIEEFKKNPSIGFDFLKQHSLSSVNKRIVLVVGIVIFLVFLVPTITSFINQASIDKYQNLSFQEVIDEGYDDGTTQKAMAFSNLIVGEYEAIGLNNIQIEELCKNYDGISAHVFIYGYNEGVLYQVSASFEQNQQVSTNLSINGDSKTTLVDEFQGDKEIISKLGKMLGNDEVVKVIDESRVMISQDERSDDGILVYRNSSPYIYITQAQTSSRDLYHFTIMYEFIE